MVSELDESMWQFFKDDGRVKRAASEALERIQWDQKILWTRIAERRGSGAMDARCVEIWCAKLANFEPEVRHCYWPLSRLCDLAVQPDGFTRAWKPRRRG